MKIRTLEAQSLKISKMAEAADAKSATAQLKVKLERALAAIKGLSAFKFNQDGGECGVEAKAPFIQISYNRVLSERYTTELLIDLCDNKFSIAVRMWETLETERSKSVEIAENDELDVDAPIIPLMTLTQAVKSAIELGRDQQAVLLERLGLAKGLKGRINFLL